MHEANYLEERVLLPLQRAISLLREAEQLAATVTQRTEQVKACEREIVALTQQKQQLVAGIEAAKKQALDTRMELQAQSREDMKKRQEEAAQWDAMREGVRVAHQREKELVAKVQKERVQAEKELAGIRHDITKRLESLQAVAR
jgi:hypothetical protein